MAGKTRERRKRIQLGIRRKVRGTQERPRLAVFRSNRAIYGQLIDDTRGVTLAAASTAALGESAKLNTDNSRQVGKKLAEAAISSGIESVVFDRSGYLYHGNVKAFADGAREGGLKF